MSSLILRPRKYSDPSPPPSPLQCYTNFSGKKGTLSVYMPKAVSIR